MFDFEKLTVYQKANNLNITILKYLYRTKIIDPYLKDQLKRATLSITLNLAEGTGRVSKAEKKRFYTIARSSVFECVAILDVLKGCQIMEEGLFNEFYSGYEELSKMLLALFRNTKAEQSAHYLLPLPSSHTKGVRVAGTSLDFVRN